MRDETGRFGDNKVINMMEPKDDPHKRVAMRVLIGDGVSRSFIVTHNLGSKEVYVSVHHMDAPAMELMASPYGPGMQIHDMNTIELFFPQSLPPPAPNSIEVRVMK